MTVPLRNADDDDPCAARRAQIALTTSQESYEKASDRYNAIAGTYERRKAELQRQIEALDGEWDQASAELRRHEDHGGIALYNRCPSCKPGRALPDGHAGECRS